MNAPSNGNDDKEYSPVAEKVKKYIRRPGIRGTRISGTVRDLRMTIPARGCFAALAGMTSPER
jgi:hypothetical protein